MDSNDLDTFAGVKTRLSEIVDAVSNDDLSLDDALTLYEEAVTLGLRASDLLEADIDADVDVYAGDEANDSQALANNEEAGAQTAASHEVSTSDGQGIA